ncbi:MAG: D-glycero-beta-D-manno-heptose 1-phosphate adenylyltransferase [Chlamydiae bacterium]|nr:D-glycero-beta-D-manno-heptose 1-phosphate adenylyltransferase [Chlamydiota bacterium]MBI3267161.1 D-glycero-beta-D-manno-heptose 1-phosphate adenylyltransferase [Chlamydiota bacterium]
MVKKSRKILPLLQLATLLKTLKVQGKKIVLTNGCFDLLHVGHIQVLEKAKREGDILVVALNTDASVQKLKGKHRPIVPLKDRMKVLSILEMVDYVTFFSEETPERIIKILTPHVLVKGGDYKPNQVVGAEHVQSKGGKVMIVPLVKGKSSSGLIKKVKAL